MPTRIEKYMDRQIRKLQSQPLLLLLVAICLIGGTMKQAKKIMPGWAVQALSPSTPIFSALTFHRLPLTFGRKNHLFFCGIS
jgi:hypothetical protein